MDIFVLQCTDWPHVTWIVLKYIVAVTLLSCDFYLSLHMCEQFHVLFTSVYHLPISIYMYFYELRQRRTSKYILNCMFFLPSVQRRC